MFIEPYLANVTVFAGNFAPRSWMFCQGQLLSIAEYTALYALIGTTYGGDGSVTFALPDLRSRVALGCGQGIGLSNYYIGEAAGSESSVLTTAQMPMHNHTMVTFTGIPGANSGAGTSNDPNGKVPAQATGSSNYNSTGSGVTLGNSAISTITTMAGASNPVSIISPYLAMNYIIAVEGIFPSRN